MMKTLHRGLMIVLVVGLLAGGVVVAQSSHEERPHNQQAVQEHLDALAEELNLTSRQRGALSTTSGRAHELMQEFHQLHTDLMTELDDTQQQSLNEMLHQKMSGFMGTGHYEHSHEIKHRHGFAHGERQDAPHRGSHGAVPHEGSGSIEL